MRLGELAARAVRAIEPLRNPTPSVLLRVALPLVLAQPVGAQEVWPNGDEWPRATPREQGLHGPTLDDLVAAIRDGRFRNIHSLLIVKNGRLVLEEYFSGWGPDRLHEQQSVSKSFTSALMGIAIQRGDISGPEARIVDFFADLPDSLRSDPRRSAMRLGDLLTMRSGTDYHEGGPGTPHHRLNRMRRGWDDFYLRRPMVSRPGTRFRYDSGGVILMSALLEQRTGMHADAYAERFLFQPLGIERTHWYRNAEGHPHTGGGLDLRPRDMAKFGLLYLRAGRWIDRQVVPADWVRDSFRQHVEFRRRRENGSIGYGYLWWILPPADSDESSIYAAMGFRGQYIFVVPEHDMVVAVTSGGRSFQEEVQPVRFLYSHILDAVRR